MIRRFVALPAVGLVLLAGCTSGGGGGPQDPPPTLPTYSPSTPASPSSSSSTTPSADPSTVPADVPTTGPNLRQPGEKPPKPQGVTDHTDAGAKAFAKFYYLTTDWAYATDSSAYMRHYFQKSCIECLNIANGIDNTRKAGHHYLGGRMTITDLEPTGTDPTHPGETGYFVTFDLLSVTVVDKAGNIKNADVAHHGWEDKVWLAWKDGAWTVVATVPVDYHQ